MTFQIWLNDAYRAVCERSGALTLSEAELLGMKVVEISSLRQDIRCDRKGHASVDVSPTVIAEAFGLDESPSEGAWFVGLSGWIDHNGGSSDCVYKTKYEQEVAW